MSDIDITTAEGRAELRKLAETATPGPWHWDDHRVPTLYGRGGELGVYVWEAEVLEASHNGECGCRASCTLELEVAQPDAEFIAAARTTVPALLDALDRSEGQAHEARVVARNTIAEADRNLIRAEAAEAALDRVRTLADDMETWCSPYGISVDYAKRIREALDGAR